MRKDYAYLQDSYYEDANSQRQRRNFLSTIDSFVNQKLYVKITLLNWEEEPIKEIAGELTSGTISKDGSSSVRRTCQLSATVSRGEYDVEDVDLDFSINKKMFVEIGIKNYSNLYKEYSILWFPQGVFFISSFAITSNVSSSVNISLTLKDKMCGLNGEVGGTFQSTVILDEMQTQSPTGETVYKKVLIYDLIQELVNHWGGENLNNIVIEDVPFRIKRVMKWTGDVPLYMRQSGEAGGLQWQCYPQGSIPKDEENLDWIQYNNGEDVGYVYDDFYYTSELSANAGETVTSVLDKIVQYLGNYEYFYDEFGVFHFREIKNYLNTTQATNLLDDMAANNYLVDIATSKDVYTFSDNSNLVSISANPQYNNIKNDYVIHGLRKMTSSDISYDVFYHLVIDNKPQPLGQRNGQNYYNTYYDLLLYTDELTDLTQAAFPLYVEELPRPGNFNVVYRVQDTTQGDLEDSIGDYQDQQLSAQEKIKELKAKLDELNARLQELESKIDQYTLVSDTAQEEIDRLTKENDEIKKVLNENTTTYTEQVKELNTMKSSLIDYKNQRRDLESKIEADRDNQELKDQLNSVIARIVVLEDDIDSLQSNTDNLKNTIDTQRAEIEKNEETIAEWEEKLNTVNVEGGSVEEYVSLIRKRSDVKEQIQMTEQEIARNEQTINDLDLRIEQAEEEIKNAEENIDATAGYAFYVWDDSDYRKLPVVKYYPSNGDGYTVLDWRTEIYLQGMLAKNNGTDAGMYYHNLELDYTQAANDRNWIAGILRYGRKNRVDTDYYFQELEAFWPQMYNLETQKFYGQESNDELLTTSLADGVYYLDFIEPQTSGLGEFSIQNIGRRMDVVNDEDINCLFQPLIPDVIFLNRDDKENFDKLKAECQDKGEEWTQVTSDVYYALATGGWRNAAFDQIKYELYLHTNYQKTLSVTALPAYYLEPNSRVTINDKSTNTYGSFVLKSLSIPLGPGNVMSGSCAECFERF
jgi:uncharacterized coiled-coil DUF342 family protein